jgi:hypothetical protein
MGSGAGDRERRIRQLVNIRRRALKKLEACHDMRSSAALVYKHRIEAIDQHIQLLQQPLSKPAIQATLRILLALQRIKLAELRLKELDTALECSLGGQLGVKPTTPCYEEQEEHEQRRIRKEFRANRPPRTQLCHRCDNPKCFNAEHWFWGTILDNMRDCAIKGRNRKKHTMTPEEYVEAKRAALRASIAKHDARRAEYTRKLLSLVSDPG